MRYASFVVGDRPTWGVAIGDAVHDLGPTGLGLAPSLKEAIRTGVFGDPRLDPTDARTLPLSSVCLLPPIPDPGKVLCAGVNYRSHQEEAGRPAPVAPTIFIRFADSQIGHGRAALRPAQTTQFDYEGELALVIKRYARNLSESDAADAIAGYAPYNDFSVRDWQRASSQWTPGKNFPGTGAFGPFLSPAADVGPVEQLRLETRVNGEIRQSASVADLVFSIPSLISYITTFTALDVGDVVVTGTPGGVGVFMNPPAMLSAGDLVEVEISGLGVLANVVEQL